MNLMRLETGVRKAGTTDLYGILRVYHQTVKSQEGGKTKEEVLWNIHSGEGAMAVYVKEDYVLGFMKLTYPKPKEPFAFIEEVMVDNQANREHIENHLYEDVHKLFPNRKVLDKTYQNRKVM